MAKAEAGLNNQGNSQEKEDILQDLKDWENHIEECIEAHGGEEDKVNDFECAEFLVDKIGKGMGEFKKDFYRLISKVYFSPEQKVQILDILSDIDLDKIDRRIILEVSDKDFGLLSDFYSQEVLDELSLEDKIKECEKIEDIISLSGIPLLDVQEERILTKRIQEGDIEAKQILFKTNLRLVMRISQSYSHNLLGREDMFQEGCIGFKKAIEKFNPDLEYKFSTYAIWWIKQAIGRALRRSSRGARIPEHTLRKIKQYREMTEKLERELGYVPSQEQILENMDWSKETFDLISRTANNQSITDPISINEPVGEDDSAERGDFIIDSSAESVEEQILNKIFSEEIKEILEKLPSREKYVLERRYGFKDGDVLKLSEIANELGISRERVRQIEMKGLERLKRKYGHKKANFF